jgi:phosphomevalonate kinase
VIRAAAPGKVVLWGEYAVLAGAPALVMAVDRRARCEIDPGGSAWRFTALGHEAAAETVSGARLLHGDLPSRDRVWTVAWHVLQALGCSSLPAAGEVRFDTRSFQDEAGRGKLGLGSSAALCVAAYGAFARLLGQPVRYATAVDVHERLQGGRGSGIDVAAAWFGGTLKFRRIAAGDSVTSDAAPWPMPDGLTTTFVFSGVPARTSDHLERLHRWLEAGGRTELDALAEAAAALFEAADPMHALQHYVMALRGLDEAAGLDIFSDAHRQLSRLAFDAGVVYKPCGAGGGDIGAAFTPDASAGHRFARLAADHGFLPLALETASHGIEVTG